ncbi:MAG: hypothetical protein LBT97_06600 [Planctomycetota bacterium]|jgi:flagellin-like hook-associated protein FlgL|nr:hypothetical protein [Planctomycetota bacterium]
MRATSKITTQNSLYAIQRNYRNYAKVNAQVSALRQVINLEDDPLSANLGMRMVTIASRTTQYIRNINSGLASLRLYDGSLGDSKTSLDALLELVIQGSDEVTSKEQYATLAGEANTILQKLITAANAYDGDRYLFGGQNTKTPPFNIVNGSYVNYIGNDSPINMLVDKGASQKVNVTGSDAYGSLLTVLKSRDYHPRVNLGTDTSTALSDLNNGSGVPAGKIRIHYSAYPEGLEVDLSGCDTIEDVKDMIEQETLKASRRLNAADHSWLDQSNLNWRDLQDRYVKVTVNPDGNGISLLEIDLGEPLPEANKYEAAAGLTYEDPGVPGYDYSAGGVGAGSGAVYDKLDYIYGAGTGYTSALRVDDVAKNKAAEGLGIKGSGNAYDPANPDAVLDGFLHGRDLSPALTKNTLLADLDGFNDALYTFYNGAKPDSISIRETSADVNNIFNQWDLTGVTEGVNTGKDGELYTRLARRGPPDDDIYLEMYTVPLDQARPSDLVATGVYTQSPDGGLMTIREANSSGLGGTVGLVFPTSMEEATASLAVDFGNTLRGSVHFEAFREEVAGDGTSKDRFNIASGWDIKGLDKPPALGYDMNHPFSTDLQGDVSVNFRYDGDANSFHVELYRPAFADQPATLIASGKMDIGAAGDSSPSAVAASGRVELVGAEGFEGISGSVYIELPVGTEFGGGDFGTSAGDKTSLTYALREPAPAGTIVLGGATKLVADQAISGQMILAGDTLFKAGQTFTTQVSLPDGSVIPSGQPLREDTVFPKGVSVETETLLEGTVLAAGQDITLAAPLPAGTVIPAGSYYESGPGFPASGMSMTASDPVTGRAPSVQPTGFNLTATFNTVQDFMREVEELGIHVSARIGADGKSMEFVSTLAGAYLTVSEDTDCYEQMGDFHQQLSGLDLEGLVKGVNSDRYGNVYTEVVHYPPDKTQMNPTGPLMSTIIGADGVMTQVEAGYYVRVYSDPEQMKLPYADRDDSKMVAEGFLPSGEWNPYFDESRPVGPGNEPFLPIAPATTLGIATGLALEERNDSGVSGRVNLNYYGSEGLQAKTDWMIDGNNQRVEYLNYHCYDNANITVFPGGMRPTGILHATIQEVDIAAVPGQNCDYSGIFHGTIANNGGDLDVRLHKDPSLTVITARNDPSEPVGPDGRVTLYEVDGNGDIAYDIYGEKIVAGSMVVTDNQLPDGATDRFELETGAARHSAQQRQDNLFATINDIIDALHDCDAERLHDLIGTVTADRNRLLEARGDVGARTDHLDLLVERHQASIISYDTVLTQRVGMDENALSASILNLQAALNAFEAAQKTASMIMGMSLLNYL